MKASRGTLNYKLVEGTQLLAASNVLHTTKPKLNYKILLCKIGHKSFIFYYLLLQFINWIDFYTWAPKCICAFNTRNDIFLLSGNGTSLK